jgi:hypothetical protein
MCCSRRFHFAEKTNRNFSRVSSGPELGAYYHEFFRRDRSHLAAQMFCKNPRTMLAMAESRVVRGGGGGDPANAGHPLPDSLRSTAVVGFSGLSLPNSGVMNSGMSVLTVSDLDKLSETARAYGHHPSLVSLTQSSLPPSTQMLERQIMLLQQQEEVNRLLLERALLLRHQRQQPQAHNALVGGLSPAAGTTAAPPLPLFTHSMMIAEEQKLQDEQSIRLRQLFGLQQGRRGDRRNQKPSKKRASAA